MHYHTRVRCPIEKSDDDEFQISARSETHRRLFFDRSSHARVILRAVLIGVLRGRFKRLQSQTSCLFKTVFEQILKEGYFSCKMVEVRIIPANAIQKSVSWNNLIQVEYIPPERSKMSHKLPSAAMYPINSKKCTKRDTDETLSLIRPWSANVFPTTSLRDSSI